jgi:hypothetical protein
MGSATREARLRPEYARLYPALSPGQWEPAAVLGGRILMWQLQLSGPVHLGERLLPDAHFEFRGGSPRSGDFRDERSPAGDGYHEARNRPEVM